MLGANPPATNMSLSTATPVMSRAADPAVRAAGDRLERWLEAHYDLVLFVALAAAFLLRAWMAWGTFFNPDEAQHVLLADKASWGQSYRASLATVHPPGLILVLYGFNEIGGSEFFLRLPSVMAGTLFCWLGFKWLRILCGRGAGWLGLILFAFLPPLVTLSAEVRQYALLLAFCAGSAYLLEEALARDSAGRMLFSAACLLGAISFHYSAILFAAAMGVYALLRMIAGRSAVRVFLAWMVGQAAAVALVLFYYRTHISRLQQSAEGSGERYKALLYLKNLFFHSSGESPARFVFARTFGVFQFLFGQLAIGDVAGALFLGAVVWLLIGRGVPASVAKRPRLTALLLLLPFGINCGLALADRYPYGGTRHSIFLSLFAIAGVSVAVLGMTRQRFARALALTAAIAVACGVLGRPRRPYMLRADQSSVHMEQALEEIRKIPATDTMLLDGQTNLVLQHYLCEGEPAVPDTTVPGLKRFQCANYRFLGAGADTPVFTLANFFSRWEEVVRRYNLPPGATVWVVQAGWDVDLADQLQKLPEFRDLQPQWFGHSVVIFRLRVGQAMPGAF